MLKKLFGLLAVVILMSSTLVGPASAEEGKALVFAAASTTNAVQDICNLFKEKGMGDATPSFASSSTLAKQIENGAPAGVYLSANQKWMNYLEEKEMIVKSSRFDLLANRIVLIAPLDSKLDNVEIKPGFALSKLLGDNKLSMGDPDHVPAGMYAKQALESLGAWEKIAAQVARSKDVRAALALVERGECPLGIVYSTDAAVSKKVKVVGLFPEDSHRPIVYPAALVAGHENDSAAKAFFEFLKTADSKSIFEKYGFSVR